MREHKTCSVSVCAINPDIASHIINGKLTNRESQSRALNKFIKLFETFKYILMLLGRNATTGICDRNQHTFIFNIFFKTYGNFTSGRSKFQGIIYQVNYNLL